MSHHFRCLGCFQIPGAQDVTSAAALMVGTNPEQSERICGRFFSAITGKNTATAYTSTAGNQISVCSEE